jgi:hypothetical protein
VSASYESWMDAFQQAYESPERVPDLACPNCGYRQLHLKFVIYGKDESEGHGSFWCANCLQGLALGPCRVPSVADRVPLEAAEIPRYKIVPPPTKREIAERR